MSALLSATTTSLSGAAAGLLPGAATPSLFHRMFFRDTGASDSAVYSDGLFMLIWWFGVFWFVLLMGLMVYWVIKYRRRPGVPAPVSASHNTPLEVFWTIVPSASLLVIFFLGFWGYMKKVVPAGDAMELQVSAWKWGWGVTYPNGAESQWTAAIDEAEFTGDGAGLAYPVFVLPEDSNVSLRMNSQDVIHSFWIPDLRVKMDVYPNRYTGYGFRTPVLNANDEVTLPDGQRVRGRSMWVFCAEYCGDMHAEMAALLYVLPKAVYNDVVENIWNTGDLTPAQLGEIVYKARCMICHSVDGSSGAGPTWAGGEFGGQTYGYGYPVQFTDGTSLDARDANYTRESILVPTAKIVQGYPGNMPSFQGQLSDAQLEGLIAYYQSLSDRGPAQTPEGEGEGDGAGEGGGDAEGTPDPASEDAPASEPETDPATGPATGENTSTTSQSASTEADNG